MFNEIYEKELWSGRFNYLINFNSILINATAQRDAIASTMNHHLAGGLCCAIVAIVGGWKTINLDSFTERFVAFVSFDFF